MEGDEEEEEKDEEAAVKDRRLRLPIKAAGASMSTSAVNGGQLRLPFSESGARHNSDAGQVDAAANAMSTLKAKMKELANNKEGGKLCAIAALSATLFVLMYLVVND